jgi:2-methylcitrate dehydratase
MELTTRSGNTFSELVLYHRGHFRNPLSDKEIEQKFCSLTKDLLSSAGQREVLRLTWHLEQVEDIHAVMESLAI